MVSVRQGSKGAGWQSYFSSQTAMQGHANKQFSMDSYVHSSGPSFRTTVKNIWLLGQDSKMKKKKKNPADIKPENMNWSFKHVPHQSKDKNTKDTFIKQQAWTIPIGQCHGGQKKG